VDLRDNLGGDCQPFQALISGIWADRAINRRGRIFGLINDFTASSAALDSYNLRLTTNALLIGQQVATPINESGNGHVLRLPHYGVLIQVTRTVNNPAQTRMASRTSWWRRRCPTGSPGKTQCWPRRWPTPGPVGNSPTTEAGTSPPTIRLRVVLHRG